jgi:8-oxo-dGTP pyrophosphatase MutT (NUDIX family)
MDGKIGDVIKVLESVDFSVLILLSKRDEHGNPLVLCLPSKRVNDKTSVLKIPGGMQKKEDRSAKVSAARECEEETGVVINPKRFWRIWTVDKPDHYGRVPDVQQHVFYCDDFNESTLRTKVITDGPDTLYVPKWVSVPYALENLFPPHRNILRDVMPKLAQRNSAFVEFVKHKGFVFPWPFGRRGTILKGFPLRESFHRPHHDPSTRVTQ